MPIRVVLDSGLARALSVPRVEEDILFWKVTRHANEGDLKEDSEIAKGVESGSSIA